MSTLLSSLSLIGTRLAFELRTFFDQIRTAYKYYSDPLFRKVDLSLLQSYIGDNPYIISKRFLKQRGEANVYAYGETFLTTIDQIVKQAELKNTDVIYELGCGRGRVCFWLALFLKAKVIGLDFVPEYINKANAVCQKFHLNNPTFVCDDFLKADLTNVTAIYLNGTAMSDGDIMLLIQRLIQLPKKTKVITVSFALTEYPLAEHWRFIKSFPGAFSWGKADIYIQELI